MENELSFSIIGLWLGAFCLVAIGCIHLWQWVFKETPNVTLEQRHAIQNRKINRIGNVLAAVVLGILLFGSIFYILFLRND